AAARLPDLLWEISRQPDVAAGYRNRYHEDLVKALRPVSTAAQFSSFVEDFFGCVQGLFERIQQQLAEHKFTHSIFGNGLPSDRLQQLDDIVHRCAHDLTASSEGASSESLRRALCYMVPLLEARVCCTRSSNALPLELLFRTAPMWRWYALVRWYRLCQEEASLPESSLPFGLPGLSERRCMIADGITLSCGPYYDAEQYVTREQFCRDHAVAYYACFRAFSSCYADHTLLYLPSLESIIQVLGKRSVLPQGVVGTQLRRADTAFAVVANTDSVREATRHEVSAAAKLASFHQLLPAGQKGKSLRVTTSQHSVLSLEERAQDEPVRLRFLRDAPVDPAATVKVEGEADAAVEDMYFRYSNDLKARVRSYNAIRIQLLGDWTEQQFGSLSHGNARDSATRHQLIESTMLQMLGEIFRADDTMLWWRNHGKAEEFSRKGFSVATSPQADEGLVLESATESPPGRVRSCFERRLPEYIADLTATAAELGVKPETGSVFLFPITYNGRVVAVLELIGESTDQFRWVFQHELQDIVGHLGPFLYHRLLFDVLRSMGEEFVGQARQAAKPGRITQVAADKLCKYLCEIFLCQMCCFWFRDESNTLKYHLVGMSHREQVLASRSLEYSGRGEITFIEHAGYEGPKRLLISEQDSDFLVARFEPDRDADRERGLDGATVCGRKYVDAYWWRKALIDELGSREGLVFPAYGLDEDQP
ncbi:MAG: hypothetical protein AAFX85_13475, partial [Pseudomonadota bacterium]